MKLNLQNILILILSLILAFFVGMSAYKSHKLVKDFENGVEKKEFKPEANKIELSEIDTVGKRSWCIKSQKSSSDKSMNIILAESVEAEVFDEKDNLKMLIKAPFAETNRETGITTLTGGTEVFMTERKTQIFADKLILEKGQPIKAERNIQIVLSSEEPNNKILCNNAIISNDFNNINLFNVSKSQVSDNLFLSGDTMNIIQSNNKTEKVNIRGDSFVETEGKICRSDNLDIAMSGGKPNIAIFTGSPSIDKGKTRIKAQRIIYTVPTGKMKAEGNVRTESI